MENKNTKTPLSLKIILHKEYMMKHGKDSGAFSLTSKYLNKQTNIAILHA